MKKIAALLSLIMLLSFAACGPQISAAESTDFSYTVDLEGITSLDELEDRIEEHLDHAISSLASRWETLSAEIDTYEKYVEHPEKVSDFYQTIETETEQMCIMLREYSAAYARMILDSDMSADDKYDAVDGINDCLYDDACDEIHDEIYEGILDDMNDYFYEGILDDAQDDVNYSDWYDVISKEYDQWYDTSSEVYGLYYDTSSDIYSFYFDMSSKLFSRDYERAEKLYEKFLQKIAKAKGLDNGETASDAIFDTSVRTANDIEELESVVDAHVSECVQALEGEWEALAADIDTFDEYMNNADAIEEFHTHIEDSASQILTLICNYGISYTELILQSDSSYKDKYKDFEDFKDCIYEDACKSVKEDIYEDLLKEVKDYYYDGIIKDAKDSVGYSDWADARGDAYDWWSDARVEVYGEWSDTRSDLYGFYTDMRSALYSGDIDEANDELQDFRDKFSNESASSSETSEGGATNDEDETSADGETDISSDGGAHVSAEAENETVAEVAIDTNGIRPEFKEAMDSYEAFYTEYCELLKKYTENPTDLTLLSKYGEMIAKAEEVDEAFEAWDEDDMTGEELNYYLEVNNRVLQKIADMAD